MDNSIHGMDVADRSLIPERDLLKSGHERTKSKEANVQRFGIKSLAVAELYSP